jgi:hypothetical protein
MKRTHFPAKRPLAVALATLTGLAALSAPSPAFAQGDDINRRLDQIQRQTRLLASPDLSATERATFDYGGLLSLSYFSTTAPDGTTRSLYQYDLNLYARVNFDGAHEFYLRNRLQYRDYAPGDETGTDDDSLQSFVEEGYYRFNLARYLAAYKGEAITDNLTLTLGRQYVEWATGLVLAQYLDAARADLELGDFTLTGIGGVTSYGTTDFDSSRPNFDKSTYRGFFGAMASYRIQQHRPFVYFLSQRDFNNDRKLRLAGAEVEFEYNSYYLGAGSTGNLSDQLRYTLEAVFETGEGNSDLPPFTDPPPLPQTDETIIAWAAMGSLDYLFNDPRRSRAGLAVIAASGDDDRNVTNDTFGGNSTGTDDNAFNALGLVAAGYAFNPPISNLLVLKLDASTYPLAEHGGILGRLQVGAEVLAYGKTLTQAPIDEFTTNGDRYLGTEAGTYLNWRVLDDVTFQLRYGVFFPGSAIPNEETRHFIYTSFSYSF